MSGGPVHVANPISAVVVDAGALATGAKQDTGNTSLSNIDGKVATSAKQDTGNTSLSNIEGKLPSLVTSPAPAEDAGAVTVAQRPMPVWRDDFDADALDSTKWDLIQTGSGMTVDQLGSSLRIKSGITADSETIIRSKITFTGDLALKYLFQQSSRTVNHEAIIELVDAHPTKVSGASWAKTYLATCTGTTTSGSDQITTFSGVVPVLGASIAGTGIPTGALITAISGSGPYTLTLNVTATASATLTNAVTHNAIVVTAVNTLKYLQWIEMVTCSDIAAFNYTTNGSRSLVTYSNGSTFTVVTASTTGTTGTISFYPIQNNNLGAHYDQASATAWRLHVHGNGYAYAGRIGVGVSQGTTTNTTNAAPGHAVAIHKDEQYVSFGDAAAVSTGVYTARAMRDSDIPEGSTAYYLQIRVKNVTAPAISTYNYFDWIGVEYHNEAQVKVNSSGQAQGKNAVPVHVVTSSSLTVAGANAHDSSTLGNPIQMGAKAQNVLVTAVSHLDTSNIMVDVRSRLVAYGSSPREFSTVSTVTLTASTAETTLIAAVASTFNDITFLCIQADSATRIDLRDTTGGSVKLPVSVLAGETVIVKIGSQPLKQTTVNTNWTVQSSASVSSVRITAISVIS